MIRKTFTLPPKLPVSRELAGKMVQLTSRFESRIMIENEQQVVNGKSLLGLLSLYGTLDRPMQLIAEGPDEEQAVAAVMAFIGSDQ